MSISSDLQRMARDLQRMARVMDELVPALESLNLCANFLRRKLADSAQYPQRTVEELTNQFLEAEGRVNNLRAKL